MNKNYIFISAILCFLVSHSLQNCVIKSVSGKPEYVCNSIQELERFSNPDNLNVTVHRDGIIPKPQQAPKLKITLLDESDEGINPTTIRMLNDLSQLLTRRSNLHVISRGIFENLPIRHLGLEENGINTIERGAFSNMSQLEDLSIVKNNLRTVENGIFNGLPVETLALSNNRIYTIKRNAFNDMKNLKNLYLDGNLLNEFLPEFLLNFAAKMSVLRLDGNLFTEMNPTALRGLDNLRELHLQNNNISKIFSYTFDNSLHLQNLVLSDNKIRELNADIFPQNGLATLEKLQINDNRLSYITFSTLARLKNLKYIRLGGNPWTCTCLDELLQWLGSHDIQQKCDRHYYSGARPICVVIDSQASNCDYTNDDFYYHTYSEIHGKYPKGPACEL